MAFRQKTLKRGVDDEMAERYKFIHWMVNLNARREADKAEHARLKRYYVNKLLGLGSTRKASDGTTN